MSAFVRVGSSIASWVRFTMPSSGRVRAQYQLRMRNYAGFDLFILFSSVANADHWRGCGERGSTSTNIRVNQLFINGIRIGSTTLSTRAQIFNAIRRNEWVTVRYDNWSADQTDNTNSFSTGNALEFFNYDPFLGNEGDIRDFKIDVGLTGAWTNESYLGNTNGFSRQNVSIQYDYENARHIERWQKAYKPPKDKTYAAITRSQSDYDSLREGLVLAICPSVSGATGYRAVDVSGRGNHGTLTNMEPEDWVSSNGVALDFNAATERVVVANKREFQFDNTSRFSVSVWLYNKGSSGLTFPHVCTGQGSNNNFAWTIEVNASTNAIVYGVAKAFVNSVGVSASASTNQWIHAVLVYDGSQVTGYKDGVATSPASWNLGTVSASDLDIWVGVQKDDTTGRRFNGSVDDFRVYNRVLTPAEIRRLASGRGVGLKPTSTQFDYLETREKTYSVIVKSQQEHSSLSEGLVGAWCPSLGASGYRLVDRSGYGNHGTLTNMTSDDWVVSGGAGALDFDGSDDFVSCPFTAFPNAFPFTMTCWFKVADTTTSRYLFTITDTASNDAWFAIIAGNASTLIAVQADATGTAIASTTANYTTEWSHACAVFKSASSRQIYLNGVAGTENTTLRSTSFALLDSISLSALRRSSNLFSASQLDDCRIYRRELTPTEISLLSKERGIGLQPRPKQYTYYQFPSGSKRRRILTGMP
jgi:hypothetical protein